MDDNLYDNKVGIFELKTSDLSRNSDNMVVSLNSNFVGNVYMLIFYAPWCGHCRNMVTDITRLGSMLSAEGFVIGTVNCEKNDDLDKVVSINSFPTIFFSSNNKTETYSGSRDLDSLLNYLCEHLGKCLKK
jgi:thiol-disulfide isomerase/thioredoxin